jgi:hypothetical protein
MNSENDLEVPIIDNNERINADDANRVSEESLRTEDSWIIR